MLVANCAGCLCAVDWDWATNVVNLRPAGIRGEVVDCATQGSGPVCEERILCTA